MWFRKRLITTVLLLLAAVPAAAQISPTYTFSSGTVISSAQVNTNFALLSNALNRTGGTITGNIAVSAGVTIDGIDLSAWLNQAVLTTSSPTFVGVTLSAALTSSSSGSFATSLSVGTTATVGGVLTVNGVGTHTFSATSAGAQGVSLRNLSAANNAYIRLGLGNNSGAERFNYSGLSSAFTTAGMNVADGSVLASAGVGGMSISTTDAAATATLRFFTGGSADANKRLEITALGHVNLLKYTETMNDVVISAGALTLNLANATHFRVAALNANITSLTISNAPPSGSAASFTVLFTADGTVRTINWPASVVWPNGTAPTMTGTNLKSDLVTCLTYNAGSTWMCAVGAQNW